MFPDSVFWMKPWFDGWYTALRCSLEKSIHTCYITHGIPINEKVEPIGRDAMKRIMKHLLSMKDSKGYSQRSFLLHVYLAIGRGSEGGLFSWNLSYWNEISMIFNF